MDFWVLNRRTYFFKQSKGQAKAQSWELPSLYNKSISKPKPKKYKLPPFYDPFGPRPPPSDKVISLADRIANLSPDKLRQVGPSLREKLRAPKIQELASDAMASLLEVRAFTNLGLKEAKELVEKAPVLLKQRCTKEEANDMIEKIKAVGGMAVMGFFFSPVFLSDC
ncbi:hypothetical protein AMTRI_Chr09g18820 [Amborella trichopoda]